MEVEVYKTSYYDPKRPSVKAMLFVPIGKNPLTLLPKETLEQLQPLKMLKRLQFEADDKGRTGLPEPSKAIQEIENKGYYVALTEEILQEGVPR